VTEALKQMWRSSRPHQYIVLCFDLKRTFLKAFFKQISFTRTHFHLLLLFIENDRKIFSAQPVVASVSLFSSPLRETLETKLVGCLRTPFSSLSLSCGRKAKRNKQKNRLCPFLPSTLKDIKLCTQKSLSKMYVLRCFLWIV